MGIGGGWMITKHVELTFPNTLKEEPIIYNIIKNFNVIPIIIEASFSTEMGWMIARFKGTEEELENLFKFLKEKEIQVNYK